MEIIFSKKYFSENKIMGMEDGGLNLPQKKVPEKAFVNPKDDNGIEVERIEEDITFNEFISFADEGGEYETVFYGSEENRQNSVELASGIFNEVVDLSQLKNFKFKKFTDPKGNVGYPNSSPEHDSDALEIPRCYTQFSYVNLFNSKGELIGSLCKDENIRYKGGYDSYQDDSQTAQWYVSSPETQMKWSGEKRLGN